MGIGNIIRLAAKEWKPDLPSVGSGYSTTVLNVLPRTPDTYGPFPNFAAYAYTLCNLSCINIETK